MGPAQAAEPAVDRAAINAVFAAIGEQSPGCALGVYRAGEILCAKGYGLADLNHGVPIRSDIVFDIGSTSKQFTAAAVLVLVQDGKLGLDARSAAAPTRTGQGRARPLHGAADAAAQRRPE